VIMDADKHIVATAIVPTGARAADAAARAMDEALSQAGLAAGDIALRVSTGYGRDNIEGMDSSVTEITCHARGAHYLAPDARSVIDIGGQDSKVIHLNANGSVAGFVMNDKCAAGTGRFMEAMARVLEMDLDEFCRRGLEWRHDVRITSMCTVFAESEVVSLVAANTPTPDVIHGLDVSVAKKTATLASRVGAEPPYLMTGGVAQNEGVVRALSEVLKAPVATHEDSQLCGAIGAALIGLDSLDKRRDEK
jgi:predicted CoA-substrate-specific enzyme activase